MTRIVPASAEGIAEAAAVLRRGGLVAFPTETVYGLGGLALRPGSVEAIYAAKGRPAHNPVIVHVPGIDEIAPLVEQIPDEARRLAAALWPGPVTMVLRRSAAVPDVVTAGGPTVALRAPSHPAAQALLRAVGGPVAAPSANRSSEVSPTTAEHVARSLGGRIDLIVDGGSCQVGLESAVVDLSGDEPALLRPGTFARGTIEAALGRPLRGAAGVGPGPLRSPGMLSRHYAPRARVVLAAASEVEAERERWRARGARVEVLATGGASGPGRLALGADPEGYARGLYGALHELDARSDVIVVELPPTTDAWEAVHDRLRRSAAEA